MKEKKAVLKRNIGRRHELKIETTTTMKFILFHQEYWCGSKSRMELIIKSL